MNYRPDHIKVLKALSKALPKRELYSVEDIAKAFSSTSNPDRWARNSLRKPRKDGHIEIAERGMYRLTQSGVAFLKKLDTYEVAEARGDKPAKAKKAAKPGKKPAKVAKPAKEAKPAKKVENKTKTPKEEKVAKPTNGAKKVTKFRIPGSKPVKVVEETPEVSEEKPSTDHLSV